jgi:hypothetical protein
MRRARPYHPMRDRKTSALGRALSPSSPPAVAFVKSGYIAIVRSEVRSGDCTRSGLLRRVFAAPRNGDALVGARCLGLDVAAYERFVEIWQRLFTHLNFPMYLSRTPVSAAPSTA